MVKFIVRRVGNLKTSDLETLNNIFRRQRPWGGMRTPRDLLLRQTILGITMPQPCAQDMLMPHGNSGAGSQCR